MSRTNHRHYTLDTRASRYRRALRRVSNAMVQRSHPCPRCHKPHKLTSIDRALGYACNDCSED